MKRVGSLALLTLAALLPLAGRVGGDDPIDRSGDVIVARSAIEARGRSHGEVRLLRRGGAAVVQTLLVTRTLKRAAGRIRDKEESSWPAGSREVGTARLYLEALEAAVAKVLEAEQTGRTRGLLIEIELFRNAGGIVLAKPVTEDGAQGLALVASEPISRLDVPCSWARREIELIAEDRGLDLGRLTPLPTCATRPHPPRVSDRD